MVGRQGNSKAYKNPSEKKRQDIQKSLVHRANLKRKYFKLLEKQGEAVPQKNKDDADDQVHQEHREHSYDDKPREIQRKPLTYGERAELIKKRKEEKRKNALESIRQQREIIETKKQEKHKKKKQLSKKTKGGQPLMAPRINDLLDKIKKDVANE